MKNSAVLTAFGGPAAYESPSGIDKSGYGYEDYNVFIGDRCTGNTGDQGYGLRWL